ncbi:MAG: nicotinate phosphoribosyltransferase [Sphaerochaetaceae bacterium]|nr:nicotinate phosphoribosyltransferase [Sphaerochaetaceae bacterium]MDC7238336.1 nicotinate phosphoribosyltransferase [Sphaerochaetaceae bacterium]MDC7251101.1 nicotinate phosphoribosyltransferase [Sphaerochaetaceae bacterium]
MNISALTTDFYELTMMQGFFKNNYNPKVVFDMFYRTNPFNGGYALFAGLDQLLEKLENFRFSEEDIDYLRTLNMFDDDFLEYLSNFKFKGTLYSMDEAEVVFAGEPLIRIHTNLIDAQLIEGMLLNTINFQTLIATKASRMVIASKGSSIMEFGLRRAQGDDGALSASRASFIGGTKVTSNTLAGRLFDIPVSGTMAHSWIMSFDSEEEAFRKFAKIYPDNCILLIDTYDTLGSGIENAIKIGLEQKAIGKKIGVRIDSGDMSYLPRVIRDRLDEAGLTDAIIVVSNDITEEIIQALVSEEVPIDLWGIGTHLVTGGFQSSLNGVYKLCAKEGKDGNFIPTMKISNSFGKTTNPAIKQVWRFYDEKLGALADLITLDSEKIVEGKDYTFYHPFSETDFFKLKQNKYTSIKPLLSLKMKDGVRVDDKKDLKQLQKIASENLEKFHKSYKRQINPHIYKVSLSRELRMLKRELVSKERLKMEKE